MRYLSTFFSLVVVVVCAFPGVGVGGPDLYYVESGGLVVGEGEIFSTRTPRISPPKTWVIKPTENSGTAIVDGGPIVSNARGGAYVQTLPDDLTPGGPNVPPEIAYQVLITTPDTYRLFVRWDGNNTNSTTRGQSDSMFADIVELKDGTGGSIADWYELTGGADGDFATRPWHSDGGFEANAAGVSGAALTWNIASPGDYTLRFTQREDGSAVDAWVFQLASLPAPTDFGPPRSAFIPEPVTVSLMALGAMGLAGYARKRRRRA